MAGPIEFINGYRLRLLLCCLSLCLLLFSHACAPRARAPVTKRPAGIYHVVKGGENLFRIGKAYDIPYQELARINRIDRSYRIRAGQKVFIPGATRQLPVAVITPLKAELGHPQESKQSEKGLAVMIWPVQGTITSKFGPRGETFHDGIDIAVPEGTPIRSVEKGEVIYSDQLRGYGNLVIIRHPGGLVSVYSHNRRNRVREGQKVDQGEIIGEAGSTGKASAPHLHFEIRKNNIARNPLYYLPPL